MNLLGIETSGTVAGVAVMRDALVVAELQVANTLTHSETIMPMIEQVLQAASMQISDIDAFAVNIGPGSFTGVRIGTCVVNALGAACGKPVIGVDSLQALYAGVMVYPKRVCALIDAKNGNAYAAQYEAGVCIDQPKPVSISEYIATIPENTLFVGDAGVIHQEYLLQHVVGAIIAPVHLNINRASSVCYCALQQHESATSEARPLYLRPSQAERMFALRQEREHG